MKVPASVEKVFDTFPIVKHAAVSLSSPTNDLYNQKDVFYLDGNPKQDEKFTPQVGLHNVIELKHSSKTQVIPSDPVSLGIVLVMCLKNKLRLPSLSNKKSKFSLVRLSYHASPENELPMLIIDSDEARSIVNTTSVLQSIQNNYFESDPEGLLLDQTLNEQFYNIWLLCLICEDISTETFQRIFKQDEGLFESGITAEMSVANIKQQIPNWNGFKARHPNLFADTLAEKIYGHGDHCHRLRSFYKEQLVSFESTLKLFIDYVTTNTSFSPVLELKLIAFMVVIDQLLDNTQLSAVVRSHESYLKRCYGILKEKY